MNPDNSTLQAGIFVAIFRCTSAGFPFSCCGSI
jgi:hypothetical protein